MKARIKACKIIAKESQNQKYVLIFHKKFYILYDSDMQVGFISKILKCQVKTTFLCNPSRSQNLRYAYISQTIKLVFLLRNLRSG